jgi:hypothetical protein
MSRGWSIWGRFDHLKRFAQEKSERNKALVADYLEMRKGLGSIQSLRELGAKHGMTAKRAVVILRRYGVHNPQFRHYGCDNQ